jgi:hypothetical protein
LIEADGGCSRGFLWKLTAPISSKKLIFRLKSLGFQHQDHQVFSVLTTPEGHKAIVVHKTGRVQIRIDLTTPYPERHRQALLIAQKILADSPILN